METPRPLDRRARSLKSHGGDIQSTLATKLRRFRGAILPLAERYSDYHPFLGIVLGGVFTEGSLNQLRSNGFSVLFFPYTSVMAAFAEAGIDAAFDESTPDATLLRKVKAYERLSSARRERIAAHLRQSHKTEVDSFVSSLRAALLRRIASIYVLPLHGSRRTLSNVTEAVTFIEGFDESNATEPFIRYEVGVTYNNGDEVRGQFKDKMTAVAFLRGMK
jgi:hypothetical protein